MFRTPRSPMKPQTQLVSYLTIPKILLSEQIPSMTLLVYALLLNRGFISRRRGYTDEDGWVYVIYPMEELAQELCIRAKSISRHLSILEEAGLIRRTRPVGNRASHIYLNVPSVCEMTGPIPSKCPPGGDEMSGSTGQKCPTSKNNKIDILDNIYKIYAQEDDRDDWKP